MRGRVLPLRDRVRERLDGHMWLPRRHRPMRHAERPAVLLHRHVRQPVHELLLCQRHHALWESMLRQGRRLRRYDQRYLRVPFRLHQLRHGVQHHLLSRWSGVQQPQLPAGRQLHRHEPRRECVWRVHGSDVCQLQRRVQRGLELHLHNAQ